MPRHCADLLLIGDFHNQKIGHRTLDPRVATIRSRLWKFQNKKKTKTKTLIQFKLCYFLHICLLLYFQRISKSDHQLFKQIISPWRQRFYKAYLSTIRNLSWYQLFGYCCINRMSFILIAWCCTISFESNLDRKYQRINTFSWCLLDTCVSFLHSAISVPSTWTVHIVHRNELRWKQEVV